MVQSSTLLVAAAFVVAPVLAAPAHHHHRHIAADSVPVSAESSAATRRSIDNADIEAREPNPFSFGKMFRGVANFAKKAVPIALKYAPMVLGRDEEGNIYVRELDEDELAYLQARDPKFTLAQFDTTSQRRRPYAPAHRLKAPAPLNLGLRELDDGIDLEEREFDPSALYFDLEERDFDFDELDARDPFSFGKIWRQATGTAGNVLNVVDKVSSTARRFGLRELDDEVMEVEARSFDELD
jgi:hypothetical protein